MLHLPARFAAYHKLIVLLLFCACALVLAACGADYESSAASYPSPLASPSRIATGTPYRLDPTAVPTRTASPTSARAPTPSPLPPTATLIPSPTAPPTATLLFTGVIVPARCVQASLDAKADPDYPYVEVSQVITTADLAVGVFNATMSDRVEHTGCVWTYQLVGHPSNADAAARAGFDLMSVATNHIKDCGLMKSWCDFAFFDTLDNLRRVGIQTVGGGKDLAEALQPVFFTLNGIRFGFVSLGDSKMNEIVFAGPDHPGIAHLTSENLRIALTQARQQADVVIALPHWGSEDIAVPNWLQRTQAQELVEAGADLVVGNHTHVVQAIQEIDGVPVFYGLGNFVFDQGLRDHRQGLILLVKFRGAQYAGYELIPTHVDPDGRVHIAGDEEAAEILERLKQSSQQIQ